MVNIHIGQRLRGEEMHILKGFSRLKFKSPEDSLDEARTSVRRWWWEYLRLSKDYWLICQTSNPRKVETQDERLAVIYKAWGDIYSCSFEEWWLERGTSVFEEAEFFPKVKDIPRDPVERFQTKMLDDHIWVDIPLRLSRRTIQRKIGEILDNYQEQRLGNRWELSTAYFRINPVQFRLNTLKKIHEVHTLHREMIVKPRMLSIQIKSAKASLEKADLFRIGKLLGVSPSNDSLIGDSNEVIKRQNRMRASVSRLLNKGDKLIANCEIGIFPSFKSVPLVDTMRFTKRQLRRHEELENEWWKLDLTSTLSSGKIDKAKRVHYEEAERSVDSSKTQKRERVVIIRDV